MHKCAGKSGDRTLIYVLSLFSVGYKIQKTNEQGLPHGLRCIFEGDLYCPENSKKIMLQKNTFYNATISYLYLNSDCYSYQKATVT